VFAKKIGIDLGTATTQVYVRGEGLVHDGPTAPGDVDDAPALEQSLSRLLRQAQGHYRLFRPDVMLCVPVNATGDERRALARAAIAAGARQAWLIDTPLAAAMGLDLPVAEARPHLICDVGDSTAQAVVISRSGVVAAHAVAVGGACLDAAIAAHVKQRHGLAIDRAEAAAAKLAIGSATATATTERTEVRGQDGGSAVVTAAELTEAMRAPLAEIAGLVRRVLAESPPRLAADAAGRGVILTGGGALLRDLDRHLAQATGVPARVAAEPQTCAVRGTRRAMGELELLQRRQIHL
jgi:rod shape-determining protein MreB and related proteins